MKFNRIITLICFGVSLVMIQSTLSQTPAPTPTMSCNYDFQTTVTASTHTLHVGESLTVTVNFVDDTGECHFALYDFTMYQQPAGDPFFNPASFHDGPPGQSSYQLSFTAIRPGQVRLIGSYYGELYQGWWQWTYSSDQTELITILANPTPHPSETLMPLPSRTPAPSATPECPETSITCQFNQGVYRAGDEFSCTVEACNGTHDPLAVDMYIILDIGGYFFFWPSWSTNLDNGSYDLPECSCITLMALSFPWPDESVFVSAQMYCAMFYADTFDLIDLSVCSFSSI